MGRRQTAFVGVRIEPELKASAEKVLLGLKMGPSEGIRLFYQQMVLRRGLPFSLELRRDADTEKI